MVVVVALHCRGLVGQANGEETRFLTATCATLSFPPKIGIIDRTTRIVPSSPLRP